MGDAWTGEEKDSMIANTISKLKSSPDGSIIIEEPKEPEPPTPGSPAIPAKKTNFE